MTPLIELVAILTTAVVGLASIALVRIKRTPYVEHDHDRHFERHLIIAIGMQLSIWLGVCVALLVDPAFGATPLVDGQSTIAKAALFWILGQVVGWGGFLLLRASAWEPRLRRSHGP